MTAPTASPYGMDTCCICDAPATEAYADRGGTLLLPYCAECLRAVTAVPLTVEDLHDTLAHEDHLGWGYACCSDISRESQRDRLDRNVVFVANEIGMTRAELLTWSNSKQGRWLADGIIGRDESPTRATVRRYMSREIIDFLVREEALR